MVRWKRLQTWPLIWFLVLEKTDTGTTGNEVIISSLLSLIAFATSKATTQIHLLSKDRKGWVSQERDHCQSRTIRWMAFTESVSCSSPLLKCLSLHSHALCWPCRGSYFDKQSFHSWAGVGVSLIERTLSIAACKKLGGKGLHLPEQTSKGWTEWTAGCISGLTPILTVVQTVGPCLLLLARGSSLSRHALLTWMRRLSVVKTGAILGVGRSIKRRRKVDDP